MNKWKLEVVLIFALLAITVFWAIGYLKKGDGQNVVPDEVGQNVLPDESDILAMKAYYYNAKEDDYKFTVEREYFAEILNELRPAQRDDEPARWKVMGDLHLSCKDGRIVHVSLYHAGPGPGAFSIETPDRPYYRAGNSRSLNDALEAACKGSKDRKKIVHR
jgi:hypothetical protein